jgi:DNA-binding transcriptional ArsR family regulator
MSYVYDIKHEIMIKPEVFDKELQDLATFAKVISHPARLAILKYLSETKNCISGDISDQLPLSRTTVSQHLKELRDIGLIHGEIDGLKINYCLCGDTIEQFKMLFDAFFKEMDATCESPSSGGKTKCQNAKSSNQNS